MAFQYGVHLPFRIMVENMNEGAVTLHSDGTIIFCNQRFADIVKKPLEKVTGWSVYLYVSESDRHVCEELLKQGLKKRSRIEINLRNGGKRYTPALLSISALQHTDIPGAMCMVVADLTEHKHNQEMVIDITKRKKTEAALQKAHDGLE